jgi:hypothetical protein
VVPASVGTGVAPVKVGDGRPAGAGGGVVEVGGRATPVFVLLITRSPDQSGPFLVVGAEGTQEDAEGFAPGAACPG